MIDEVLDAVEYWDEESRETGLDDKFRLAMKLRLDKEMVPLRP